MDISSKASIYPQNIGNSLPKLSNNKDVTQEESALREACQGFEAIFIQSMLKGMRSTLPGDDLFGKNNSIDTYTSMHDQYLAENISKGENGVGIGEYLYRQLQESL